MGLFSVTGVKMARDFDAPIIYDPLVKPNTFYMSDIWIAWWATFMETLASYLSQNGIFIPSMTEAQRDAIQNPVNGQMIYNTDTQQFQGRENGAWRVFTLV